MAYPSGVVKTTLYLPDDVKRAVEVEAQRRNISEAEVIRESLRHSLLSERPRPRGGLFDGNELVADRTDHYLVGFGEA